MGMGSAASFCAWAVSARAAATHGRERRVAPKARALGARTGRAAPERVVLGHGEREQNLGPVWQMRGCSRARKVPAADNHAAAHHTVVQDVA